MIARILVALDESPRAPLVFHRAAGLAEAFGAELILFRAIDVPPEFPAAGAAGQADELGPHMERAAREALLTYARERPDLTGRVLVHANASAHESILRAARENDVALIVVGSHGYHGLDRILGTTAGMVANLADRDVFVVHARTARSTGSDLDPPDV
ncbi:MAG: universal stress protein [Pseudomonadota bacterium]